MSNLGVIVSDVRRPASFGKALNFVTTSSQYVTIPSAVWFSGSFTLEGWVYVRSYAIWARLFDFGGGPASNNVLLATTQGTTGIPAVEMFNGASTCNQFVAVSALPTNTWTHLATTFDSTSLLWTIYVNGVSVKTGTSSCAPPGVTRTLNYIGKSNWADAYADGLYDDMRIWNVARTASQILTRCV